MRKEGKFIFRRAALIACVFAVLASASVFAGGSKDSGQKKYKIGFSPFDQAQQFHVIIWQTVKQEVEKNGGIFVGLDPNDDAALQISQVEDMIAQKIDLLIISSINSDQILPALEKCKAAGIPVINYDVPANDQSLVASLVTSDNFLAGKLAGEYLLKNVGTKGKVIVCDNPQARGPALRVEGFEAAIKGSGIEPIYYHWKGTWESIHTTNEDAIGSHPDALAYFGTVSVFSIDAYAVLDAQGRTGKLPIISVDGDPDEKALVPNGGILAISAQSPMSIAKTSVEVAFRILRGEKVEPVYQIPTFIIDKSNIAQYNTGSWQ
jgi:ribose transport system substrate-binding protein